MSTPFTPPGLDGGLTAPERQVVRLVAAGLKDAQIAARLSLGEAAFVELLSAVYGKLGAGDRLELIVLAYRRGLV